MCKNMDYVETLQKLVFAVPHFIWIAFLCILAVYIWGTYPYMQLKYLGIPGPKPTPFWGNLPDLKEKGGIQLYTELIKKYGNVCSFHFGRYPGILVADPEIIRDIMTKEFSVFLNRSSIVLGDQTTKSMVLHARDAHWKFLRTKLSPNFTAKKLRRMVPLIRMAISNLENKCEAHAESGDEVDIILLFGCYTMDVIASTSFGIEVDSQNDSENMFVKNAHLRNSLFTAISMIFFKFMAAPRKFFVDFCWLLLHERKRNNNNENNDLLQMMINTQQEPNSSEEADGAVKTEPENTNQRTPIFKRSKCSLMQNECVKMLCIKVCFSQHSNPNALADTDMDDGSRHHMMGGCPHGCAKHQICVVSAMGGRCVKKHPIREGGTFLKHFHPKSTLELESFEIDDSRHQKPHQVPVVQEVMQLSSDHVDPRVEARISKRVSAPSLEQHAEKPALTEAQLLRKEINDTQPDNFLSANKPGLDTKQRMMPSPTEGRQTNLANYFMSLRKEPLVQQKVLKKLPECHREQLEDIMKRLTGWFVLLHAKFKENQKYMADGPVYQIPNLSLHRAANKTKHHFSVKKELNSFYKSHKCHCVRSIIWEFKHLDLDSDKHIDHSELSKIEKNDMEPCVKPFIDSCDRNGDSKLTRHEWCCCFAAVRPPCFTHLRRLQSDAAMKSATFVPHCDRDGYYEKRQCHKGICWCVDLNGNEISGTRTKGTPHCGLHEPPTETLHLYIPKKHIMIRNAEVGIIPRTKRVGQGDISR